MSVLKCNTTRDIYKCGICNQQRLRSACAYAQSDQSLCLSLEHPTSGRLLTEHHLEFISLEKDCTGSSESTLVKCHIVGNYMYIIHMKMEVLEYKFGIPDFSAPLTGFLVELKTLSEGLRI